MEKYLSRILQYGTTLSTYGLIFSVCMQIFARFFLDKTPPWTEEASRMFFIYAISFAAGLALQNNLYVSLDAFFHQFPLKLQKILEPFIPSVTFILFAIFSIFSIKFVILGYSEYSPSMNIRMAYVFLSMPILGISMSFYSILATWKAINDQKT